MLKRSVNSFRLVNSGGSELLEVREDGTIVASTNGIFFPTSAGTASELEDYEETTAPLTVTCQGITNVTCSITKIGNKVTLTVPTVTDVGFLVGNTFIYVQTLDARFRPAQEIEFPLSIDDGGAKGIGVIVLQTDGKMRIWESASKAGWSLDPAMIGFPTFSITYTV